MNLCLLTFTPKAIRGGNDFYVKPNSVGVRLHSLWDGLLGSSVNPRTQWNYAIELAKKHPRKSLPELTQHTSPKAWSLESRVLAIDKGYLRGELKGSTEADSAPALPDGYTKAAKVVAEKRGALAGYRLADEVKNYLKCNHSVPLLPLNTNTVAKAVAPKKIGAAEATKYYDEAMIVTGKVAQVTVRPTVTFINLDDAGPNSPFTAVIFRDNAGLFGDVQKLKGQSIEISGTVIEYRGKPEIILEETNQIRIVGGK